MSSKLLTNWIQFFFLWKETKCQSNEQGAGTGIPVSAQFPPVPTLTQVTTPMIGREEKERLHHTRMPYTSAVAGGAMVRLVNGVPKIQNPRTGKWIKVGGTLYRKLFREGRLSASSPARLQPIPTGLSIRCSND